MKIKQMLKRHREEIDLLRESCPHANLKKSSDRSQIGLGTCWPRIDIVCKDCGSKKMIFFRSQEEYANKANIQNTLSIQEGFQDQRSSVFQYEYELE